MKKKCKINTKTQELKQFTGKKNVIYFNRQQNKK